EHRLHHRNGNRRDDDDDHHHEQDFHQGVGRTPFAHVDDLLTACRLALAWAPRERYAASGNTLAVGALGPVADLFRLVLGIDGPDVRPYGIVHLPGLVVLV